MTSDTLPELPVVAYLNSAGAPYSATSYLHGVAPREPADLRDHLVRKSDAKAALRAQAEEVAALRALLRECQNVAIQRGELYLCDAIDNAGEAYQSQFLADRLAATKQENPDA